MSAESSSRNASFAPTQWTVVLAAAGGREDSKARQALEVLARAYWFPIYAFVRRRGKGAAEAEDLTQEFFTRLLEKKSLAAVDREKGMFRSFLLASVTHFLANEADKARALKRGGGVKTIALEAAEERYRGELAEGMTPERVFEQRWAWTVLEQVMGKLREAYEKKGQGKLFEGLKGALTSPREMPYGKLAAELGMAEGTVGVAVHRLRREYRKILREQIAQTVAEPGLIDEELRYLMECL